MEGNTGDSGNNPVSVTLTIYALISGFACTLDSIEQLGRLALLALSLISVSFLILVNFDGAVARFKKFFNGNK